MWIPTRLPFLSPRQQEIYIFLRDKGESKTILEFSPFSIVYMLLHPLGNIVLRSAEIWQFTRLGKNKKQDRPDYLATIQ